ncbi:tetratricopeptide (TPR) repeat protein [Kutzneria viridogrisea]|uniref:Tetratricopeptide (TPR) repeat protein n=1 Tax=Kutzneria viridogrisea TaxID=47990 RepID=A0ABR6BVZ6_9PSEU|nr:tetratricopeptide (TPR) repeat protein [Kutzneria viridogrisea]
MQAVTAPRTPRNGGPIPIVEGSPLARAVTAAKLACERKDLRGADDAYRRACSLAADKELWTALVIEHLAQLLALGDTTLALRRCEEHLGRSDREHPVILLVRAEIRSKLGSHAAATADTRSVRAALGDQTWLLSADNHARLLRVEGLAAADRGDLDLARQRLDEAENAFGSAGNQTGVARIDHDRVLIGLHQGETTASPEELRDTPPRTAADYLRLALAFKRELRFEEAADVLRRGVDDAGVDRAQRLPVVCELIVLLRMIRQYAAAEQLYARLAEAAAQAPDRAAAEEMLARVNSTVLPATPHFHSGLWHAHRLIAETRLNDLEHDRHLGDEDRASRLDEAESTLLRVRDWACGDRAVTSWHLVTGELELAGYNFTGERVHLVEAVKHLVTVMDRAEGTPLAEVRAFALRLLGHAYFRLAGDEGGDDRAAQCWDEAHRIEEDVAARQRSEVRVEMLQAARTEQDEKVIAAAAAYRSHAGTSPPGGEASRNRARAEAAAGVVVAMEAARGATILSAIDPDATALTRGLPRPNDPVGSWRWLCGTTRELPESQAVWMMHVTRRQVHHAIVSRDRVDYVSVAVERKDLEGAVDSHKAFWGEETLDHAISDGSFERSLAVLAERIGVAEVVGRVIPPGVSRIAIVAGGALSDVPFAGLPVPGTGERLGLRYALSDLPCLSALGPLRRRAQRQRGDRPLLVRPPASDLTKASRYFTWKWWNVLKGEKATPGELRERLRAHRHHWVRIDSHGKHAHEDPAQSYLELAPEGPQGHLRPESLQGMDLSHCGTVVFGACESGMAKRRGREERTGLVRAAVVAGAASVLASRWVAEDRVAAFVLDRFGRYIRHLPRDVALQRALLDVQAGALRTRTDLTVHDHPAWWACWTLHGDTGPQTGVGPTRLRLRRELDKWRSFAFHRKVRPTQGLHLLRGQRSADG